MIFLSFCIFLFVIFFFPIWISSRFAWKHGEVFIYGFSLSVSLSFFWMYFLATNVLNLSSDMFIGALFVACIGIMFTKTTNEQKIFLLSTIKRTSLILLLLAPITLRFGDVYTAWDAISSYNRWAIQIFSGEYSAPETAYPVLIPSIMALVYEFQGTHDIWWTAKISLILFPAFFLLIAISAYLKYRKAMFFIFPLLTYHYLVYKGVNSGEVDFPLALAGLSVLLLCYTYTLERNVAYLFAATILGGLTSLIKQPGLAFLIFPTLFWVTTVNWKTINQKTFWSVSTIIVTFMLASSFPASFYYLQSLSNDSPTSNLNYLIELASNNNLKNKITKFFGLPKPTLDWLLIPVSLLLAVYSFFITLNFRHRLLIIFSLVFFFSGSVI